MCRSEQRRSDESITNSTPSTSCVGVVLGGNSGAHHAVGGVRIRGAESSSVIQVIGWLKWGGLAAALAGLLMGAITTGVGHFGSNQSASAAGRKWLLGGMGAAILSGLAWTIATTLYSATGG
jgi:hypothetical protein